MMAWDYANECALPEKELRADKARWAASEKAKWSNEKMSHCEPETARGSHEKGSK